MGLSARRFTEAPTLTKKRGTKKCPSAVIPFSISCTRGEPASNSPAANAPSTIAEPALSAIQARARAMINARMDGVPGRSIVRVIRASQGSRNLPIKRTAIRKPNAIPATDAHTSKCHFLAT